MSRFFTVVFTTVFTMLFNLSMCLAPLRADEKDDVLEYLNRNAPDYADIAHQIWNHAELGYLETKSSGLLKSKLANAGCPFRRRDPHSRPCSGLYHGSETQP